MRNFLTFALFAVPAVAFAQAQGAPTVAIAEVTARGNADADMASEVNDALTDQLVSDGRFRVVERQQIAKVMKEQMLAQSGVMSDEVQIKVAQLVGARFIVLGSVGTKGRSYALSLRALDSTSAQVAFSETLKVGTEEQIEAGSKQLARKLADKLVGPSAGGSSQSAASADVLGDFDAAQVKDGAQAVARSLALRFPKLTGRIVNALPNGTASCSFDSGEPFKGEFFEVSGRDDVTEQLRDWFADPAHFETVRREPLPHGELVEFTLHWNENGIPHACHQAHILELRDGRISRDTAFCGGRWPADLLARMAASS